jgi:hypothetical protein
MSILTLLITFLGSLFKSHRQLALENLALRQQVTMLRQSVKRPRATAADWMFRSKRDVNKRKHQTSRRTRQPVAKPYPPKAFHHIIGVKSPSPSGLTGVSTYPCTPYFFPYPQS